MYLPSLVFCRTPRINFFYLPSLYFAGCLVQLIYLPTNMFCRQPYAIVLFAYTGAAAIQEGSTSTMDTYLHGRCDTLLLLCSALSKLSSERMHGPLHACMHARMSQCMHTCTCMRHACMGKCTDLRRQCTLFPRSVTGLAMLPEHWPYGANGG